MSIVPSALSVVSPLALWSLLALAIPILIHLFNRSRGRLVRIGHIDLVRQARSLKVTEVKLAQWVLLLLRLVIFTLAALILAGLARQGLKNTDSPTAYVTSSWLQTAQQAQIETLFSGHETDPASRILLLAPEFPVLDQTTANGIRNQARDPADIGHLWPLLADRLSLVDHDGQVDVYATDHLLQFGIAWPALPHEVSWNISHPKAMIAATWQTTSAVIAHDKNRSIDAAYFRAALTSLQSQRIPQLSWKLVDSGQLNEQQLNADWLIYLSESQLSDEQLALITTPTTILMDASGNLRAGEAWYSDLPFYPFSTFRVNGLGSPADQAQTLLSLQDGQPLLQQWRAADIRILQFNSRFNPQWSSITQQAEFPELLLQLLLTRQQQVLTFADARINPDQLKRQSTRKDFETPMPRRPLQGLLALLLVISWVGERWLSERKRRDQR